MSGQAEAAQNAASDDGSRQPVRATVGRWPVEGRHQRFRYNVLLELGETYKAAQLTTLASQIALEKGVGGVRVIADRSAILFVPRRAYQSVETTVQIVREVARLTERVFEINVEDAPESIKQVTDKITAEQQAAQPPRRRRVRRRISEDSTGQSTVRVLIARWPAEGKPSNGYIWTTVLPLGQSYTYDEAVALMNRLWGIQDVGEVILNEARDAVLIVAPPSHQTAAGVSLLVREAAELLGLTVEITVDENPEPSTPVQLFPLITLCEDPKDHVHEPFPGMEEWFRRHRQ